MTRGLVVIRIVHPPGDRGVVIAENGSPRRRSHEIGAFVGRTAIPNRVPQAVVDVDSLGAIGLENRRERLVVGVNVAENPQTHAALILACGIVSYVTIA